MAILPVRIYGDPLLRKRAERLENIDAAIDSLAKNMYATLAKQNAIGLAAPQVGLSRRLFAADTSPVIEGGSRAVFINPEIISTDGEAIYEEGCLSFPGIYFDLHRPRRVGIKYLDLDGSEHNLEANGVLARIILHEFDHLEGRLFVDLLTEEAREKIKKLMRQRNIIPAKP